MKILNRIKAWYNRRSPLFKATFFEDDEELIQELWKEKVKEFNAKKDKENLEQKG